MSEFYRIQRLPPYVFNIVNELKSQARARGEDIIDFGMGKPTGGQNIKRFLTKGPDLQKSKNFTEDILYK